MKQSKAAILVLLAGALWGSMGLFVRKLNAAGLYAMDVGQHGIIRAKAERRRALCNGRGAAWDYSCES